MKKLAYILASLFVFLLPCCTPADEGGEGKDKTHTVDQDSPIVIDGKFEDWGAIEGAVVSRNSSESVWDAVKELRVYASGDYVYYYIRFDQETISYYLQQNDVLPARVNLNTDGEFTSGYEKYFLRPYDFIIEMSLGNGAGGWGDATDGALSQRIDGEWADLLGENSGLIFGAGAGIEYELYLDKSIFNKAAAQSSIPMPMGSTFQTSMRFYETSSTGKWEELSNIPNTNDGYGDLLDITFAE